MGKGKPEAVVGKVIARLEGEGRFGVGVGERERPSYFETCISLAEEPLTKTNEHKT
jgi:hypothetical protein